MSDIVKRLRDAVLPIQEVWPLRLETAERIDELKAALKQSCEDNRSTMYPCPLQADNERLAAKCEYLEQALFKSVCGHPRHHPSWGCPQCKQLRNEIKAALEGDE